MASVPPNLGPYPVERELGRGGMGVVYLGRAPRLNRLVAIKVLSDALTLNPDGVARFEREARVLASLNHPNIAAIYGVESADQQQLLVLEYVPGDTLAARLTRGPLPIAETLDICRQIALAVEAAHEGGVIHRDLKPGNVKVTPDGAVKVLDFGLAKSGAEAASTEAAQSPTMAYSPTGIGVILGTAGYMSPEQARGRPVDRRTDIWSFGCVLFECLTGVQPFRGDTVVDSIARVLERDPDWAALPASTPPRVRDLLRRCLERDPKQRLRDIGEARIELEQVAASSVSRMSSTPQAAPAAARPVWQKWAAAAALVVAGAVIGIGAWRVAGGGSGAGATQTSIARLSIAVPSWLHADYGGFARNGRTVVISGTRRKADGTDELRAMLYTRGIDEYDLKPLAGSEGVEFYVVSPNGDWIAAVVRDSEQSEDRRIMKLRVDGSAPPMPVADWNNLWRRTIAWLEDEDLIVIAENSTKLVRLPSGGGPARAAVPIDFGGVIAYPVLGSVLPGGRGVLFGADAWGPRGYQFDQWLLDPKTARARKLIDNGANAVYVPSGHIVFTRGESLWALPFNLARLEVTGDPVTLESGARTGSVWEGGAFEIAGGNLIYPAGGFVGNDRQLVAVDTTGAESPVVSEKHRYEDLVVSRDGRRVAVVVSSVPKGTYEIWVSDRDRPDLRRVAAFPNADCDTPRWSPDGTRLSFYRNGLDGKDGIYVISADGLGSPHRVFPRPSDMSARPEVWSADGSGLFIIKRRGEVFETVFVPVSTSGDAGPSRAVPGIPEQTVIGGVSPDGKLAALWSPLSAMMSVAQIGPNGSLGPPLAITRARDVLFAWSADSRRVLFVAPPDALMQVTIETAKGLSASVPIQQRELKKLRTSARNVSLAPDGRAIYILNGPGENDITEFHVGLNWTSMLPARVAASR